MVHGHALDDRGRADLAAAFEQAIVEVLIAKSLAALEQTGLEALVVAGGVGANRRLREQLTAAAAACGDRVFYPEPVLCTDNGAMIAFAGALRLAQGAHADCAFTVRPRWELESLSPPG
jgi:N6-L-threonylcarbamoyladenine synthase